MYERCATQVENLIEGRQQIPKHCPNPQKSKELYDEGRSYSEKIKISMNMTMDKIWLGPDWTSCEVTSNSSEWPMLG